MSEAQRIESQLRAALSGEAWHGPSVLEVLADVTAEKALARPVREAHSIWDLALHITAWVKAATRALAGERIELTREEDWPSLRGEGDDAWRRSVQELEDAHRKLGEAVLRLRDDRLNEVVAGKKYTVYVLLHGVVQHTLYHAGQIAVLKKC